MSDTLGSCDHFVTGSGELCLYRHKTYIYWFEYLILHLDKLMRYNITVKQLQFEN